MREKVRERESRSLAKVTNKDYRDGLFSIFVDNLHPSMDQRCLWEIFKTFGRVRDVFMSPSHRMRGSNYAFVRFASMEEVEKVSRLSNGCMFTGGRLSLRWHRMAGTKEREV